MNLESIKVFFNKLDIAPFVKFVRNDKCIEFFTIIGLLALCYLIFFHGIGSYALMDVDETRYVSMARDMFKTKDFLTLYLNGDFFFEKPPLYFWGECLSFAAFGKINEFTARFPVAVYGTLSTFLLYFVGRKVVSREFGVISALILATSLEFVILAKFAILDIVVATCVGFSIFLGFLTFFCKEQNKKYFWWLFYIFSGLAVMAKGIPGFIIPFGTMFFASIYMKKFKEIFQKQYIIPGMIVFLAIVLPWHIIMLKMHNPLFFDEYIIKHHLHRFTDSKDLGRKEPFYFYFLTFLWGFFPWILSLIAVLITKLKNAKELLHRLLAGVSVDECEGNISKIYTALCVIGFLFTILFFSASSTKLITYILPLYFFSAVFGGYIWKGYITEEKYKKPINISVYILGGICILASIVALFTKFFLPEQLYSDIYSAKWLCIILLFTFGAASSLFAYKNKRVWVFVTYVLFMACLSGFGTGKFFKIDYKFGQDDLMEFAKYAKTNDFDLATFGFGRRYSLIYYYGGHVNFIQEDDYPNMGGRFMNPDEVIIVRKKELDKVLATEEFVLIKEGRKYALVK